MKLKVTVSALVKHNEKYLVCTQKCGIFIDTFHIPGGAVEDHETCDEALKREIKEECNLEICNIHRFGFDDKYVNYEGNDIHYIFLRYIADACSDMVTPGDDVKETFWVTEKEFLNLKHNEVTLKFISDLQSAGLMGK